MASLAELREQRHKMEEEKKKLDKQIAEAEAVALSDAKEKVWNKIDSITDEEKERILSSMEHEYSSCSKDYCKNGYSSYNKRWNCRKCMMEEILNGEHGGRFDFKFTVDIFEVTV
jgi:hypothetical protein